MSGAGGSFEVTVFSELLAAQRNKFEAGQAALQLNLDDGKEAEIELAGAWLLTESMKLDLRQVGGGLEVLEYRRFMHDNDFIAFIVYSKRVLPASPFDNRYAMKKVIIPALLALTAAAIPQNAFAAGDAANGAKLYPLKCGACHALDTNKIGPMQHGVVGRKAGTAVGYTYSPALKASGVTWDEAAIDKWLINPLAMVPGTKMQFRLPDPKERADIIAYLKSVPANK